MLLLELHRLHRGHRPGHGGTRLPSLDAEEAAAAAAPAAGTTTRRIVRISATAASSSRPPSSAADPGAAAFSGAGGRAAAASPGCDFLRDEQPGHRRAYRGELVAVHDPVGRLFGCSCVRVPQCNIDRRTETGWWQASAFRFVTARGRGERTHVHIYVEEAGRKAQRARGGDINFYLPMKLKTTCVYIIRVSKRMPTGKQSFA